MKALKPKNRRQGKYKYGPTERVYFWALIAFWPFVGLFFYLVLSNKI